MSELGTKDETPGIASVDAVKRPTITNPDRARKIDDLQDAFRRKNQEVGGRFLVEVPLGDGSDRIVQVLRPDALKYAKTNFDPKASTVDPNLLNFFAGDGDTTYPALPVVLPEIGNSWVFGSIRYVGDNPGVEEFTAEIMGHDSISLNWDAREKNFLDLAQKNGLSFYTHPGLEADDTPSYAHPMGTGKVQILSRGEKWDKIQIRELHKLLEGWKGGVPAGGSGIVPVRGNVSTDLFNLAIKGAFERAKEIERGPSPDRNIRNTMNLLEDLK